MKAPLKSTQNSQTKQVVSKKSINNRVEIFLCCLSMADHGTSLNLVDKPSDTPLDKTFSLHYQQESTEDSLLVRDRNLAPLFPLSAESIQLELLQTLCRLMLAPTIYVSSNVHQSCYGQKTLFPWCHPSSLSVKILFIIALWALRGRI